MPRIPKPNVNTAPSGRVPEVSTMVGPTGTMEAIGKAGGAIAQMGQKLAEKGNTADYLNWESEYNGLASEYRTIKAHAKNIDNEGYYTDPLAKSMDGKPVRRNIYEDLDRLSSRQTELRAKGDSLAFSERAKRQYNNVASDYANRAEQSIKFGLFKKKAKDTGNNVVKSLKLTGLNLSEGEMNPLDVQKNLNLTSESAAVLGDEEAARLKESGVDAMIKGVAQGIERTGMTPNAQQVIKVLKANGNELQARQLELAVPYAQKKYVANTNRMADTEYKKFMTLIQDTSNPELMTATADTAMAFAERLVNLEPAADLGKTHTGYVNMASDIISEGAYAQFLSSSISPEDKTGRTPNSVEGPLLEAMTKRINSLGIPEEDKKILLAQTKQKLSSKLTELKERPEMLVMADTGAATLFKEGNLSAGLTQMEDMYRALKVAPSRQAFSAPELMKTLNKEVKAIKDTGNPIAYASGVVSMHKELGKYSTEVMSNLVRANKIAPAAMLFDGMGEEFLSRAGQAVYNYEEGDKSLVTAKFKEASSWIGSALTRTKFNDKVLNRLIDDEEVFLPTVNTTGGTNTTYTPAVTSLVASLAFSYLDGDVDEAIDLAMKDVKENFSFMPSGDETEAVVVPKNVFKNPQDERNAQAFLSTPSTALGFLSESMGSEIDYQELQKNFGEGSEEYEALDKVIKTTDSGKKIEEFNRFFGDRIVFKSDPRDKTAVIPKFRSEYNDLELFFKKGNKKGIFPVTFDEIRDAQKYVVVKDLKRREKELQRFVDREPMERVRLGRVDRELESVRNKLKELE